MKNVAAFALTLAITAVDVQAANSVAQLGSVSGKVFVNQGEGFVPAGNGFAVNAGDRILVGDDGAAIIHYQSANCAVNIASASVVSIQDNPPCAEGENTAAVGPVLVNAAASHGAGGFNYAHFFVPAFIVGTGGLFTWRMVHEHRQRRHRTVSAP